MAAIFPLIRIWPDAQETAGTAFLVSSTCFVTAAHIPESTPGCRFVAATDPANLKQTCDIEWVAIALALDLAIGRLAAPPFDAPLALALKYPDALDAPLRGAGFPAEKSTFYRGGEYLETGRAKVEVEARYRGWSSDINIGASTDYRGFKYAPRKMAGVLSWPPFHEGFSGGPVFDADGKVVAVNLNTVSDQSLMKSLNSDQPFSINAGVSALWPLLQQFAPADFQEILQRAQR